VVQVQSAAGTQKSKCDMCCVCQK